MNDSLPAALEQRSQCQRWGLLLCAVAGMTIIVPASEYFVSPAGSPTNNGTELSPWPSVDFALSNALGGDVITLLPGIYTAPVVVERSGTIERPTTIRSQRKWAAVIQGSPSHGVYVADGVSNVVVEGLRVAGSAIDGVKVGSHAVVRDCWIHDSGRQGIAAHRTCGTVLERNLIERNGSDPVFDHGIYLSGTNNTVRCNVIRWNQCYGVQFYADGPGSSGECRFYNNLVYGNRNALTVWSPSGQTNHVVNNTLLSDRYVLRANAGVLCASNNILVGPSARQIFCAEDGAEIRADYNLISVSGRRRGNHDIMESPPGFVNPERGLFWLRTESPARAAAALMVSPVDFFGRVQNAVLDVGAFQYRANLAVDTRMLDPSPAQPDYWLIDPQNQP